MSEYSPPIAFHDTDQIKSNQIKIYIAPYVHTDSEALGDRLREVGALV